MSFSEIKKVKSNKKRIIKNIIFFVIGILLIVFGINGVYKPNSEEFDSFLDNNSEKVDVLVHVKVYSKPYLFSNMNGEKFYYFYENNKISRTISGGKYKGELKPFAVAMIENIQEESFIWRN